MATPNTPWLNTFEPKRDHKFVLELANVRPYFITDVTIPQATVAAETVHNFLSHKFKFPGKLTWNDSVFTLVDPIDLNAAGLLVEHLRGSGYVFPTAFNTDNPASPDFYLKTIKKQGPVGSPNLLEGLKITSLNSDGQKVESWYLRNAFVKQVDFGGYKYEGEALKNIKVTVSVDWVDYENFLPAQFNINTTVPR
jgi:hypothetical protein